MSYEMRNFGSECVLYVFVCVFVCVFVRLYGRGREKDKKGGNSKKQNRIEKDTGIRKKSYEYGKNTA